MEEKCSNCRIDNVMCTDVKLYETIQDVWFKSVGQVTLDGSKDVWFKSVDHVTLDGSKDVWFKSVDQVTLDGSKDV